MSSAGKSRVVVVTTGGTIAAQRDPSTGGLVPIESGGELLAAIPGLADYAEVRLVDLCNADGSQMTPEIWSSLVRTLDQELADPDTTGAVVTHGTDTLAEASYFVDLTLRSKKPVAFVGAMRSATDLSTDGPDNLKSGVIQVTCPSVIDWGVTLTMNRRVNSPRHVRKTETLNLHTFESGEKGCLGYIASDKVFRLNTKVHRTKFELPEALGHVALVAEHAGADGGLVRAVVGQGAAGIVVEALGAGNVGVETYRALLEALEVGVPVVIATSVTYGPVLPEYGGDGGGASLVRAGALMAADLTPAKACVHLMLALAQSDGDRAKLRTCFEREYGAPLDW